MTKEELQKIMNEEGSHLDFEVFGLKAIIARHEKVGHWCGYVQVPKDSVLYRKDYYTSSESEIGISNVEQAINDINVHGGITYSGSIKQNDDWWFGFDTAHYGDLTLLDIIYGKNGDFGVYRTKEYVINECKKLAKQINKIIKKYETK